MRRLGFVHAELQAKHGGVFAVTRCALRFRAPARLDDELAVETRLLQASGARLLMCQSVRRDAAELVAPEVELAFLGADLRPRRLPSQLPAIARELAAKPGDG